MVQVKENYKQRGYRKVWDVVLNDYEGVEFKGNMRIDGIVIRFGNQRRFLKS